MTIIVWEQRKLGNEETIFTGYPFDSNLFTENGEYLVVTNGNIQEDSPFVLNVGNRININDSKILNDYILNIGDILVTMDGTVGRVSKVASDKLILAQRVGRICTKSNENFVYYLLSNGKFHNEMSNLSHGGTIKHISLDEIKNFKALYPVDYKEVNNIGEFFRSLDNLITLHQRKYYFIKEVIKIESKSIQNELFYDYYAKWIKVYKEGAVRSATLKKYQLTLNWIIKLVPNLKVKDINRISYQQLLNDYAMTHEKQTTLEFHHQLKGAILDAVDEGLIDRDPTRKAIIKGKVSSSEKKIKYLNQFELHTLLTNLNLSNEINWDWFILLVAKTGLRFSEALALTPADFDFSKQQISVNKTWNYKEEGGFSPTKNASSVRKIQIDWQLVMQFSELIKGLPAGVPIFVKGKVYNSTVNDILERHCKKLNIPIISIHGLRHTHASILLFAGVSIASVARRLGHSSMNTTQKTYLHVIQELENKDIDLVMRSLSILN